MDKIDRLLDAVEHPDRYSDEELEAMLQDHDTREVYDLMSKTRDAYIPISKVDVDAEWHSFKQDNSGTRPRIMVFFNRHAAAIIIGALATLGAVAAGIGTSISFSRGEAREIVAESPTDNPASEAISEEISEVVVDPKPEIIVFKEETLGNLLGTISDYYQVRLIFKSDEAKALRLHLKWDQSKPLTEVVEMLNNFKQIKITLRDDTLTVEKP